MNRFDTTSSEIKDYSPFYSRFVNGKQQGLGLELGSIAYRVSMDCVIFLTARTIAFLYFQQRLYAKGLWFYITLANPEL